MSENPDGPNLIRLSDRSFVRQAVDNMAWIKTGEHAVVIDTLEQAHLEEEVFSAISDTIGTTPVKYVINTHTHYDHVALNDAFVKRYNSTIINAQTTDIPDEGYVLDDDEISVKVIPVFGCHTSEDCYIYVEEESLLFVGDVFGWGLIPWDGSLTQEKMKLLFNTYKEAIDLEPKTVVPGHGPLCGTKELKRWIGYVEWLIDQAPSKPAPPEDMHHWWRFVEWKHEDNLKKLFGYPGSQGPA